MVESPSAFSKAINNDTKFLYNITLQVVSCLFYVSLKQIKCKDKPYKG